MKKKKTPCTFLIITLIVSVAMAAVKVRASTQPLIYVEPPTYTATALGEFTINISIANASNLQVAQFRLGYNTTLLDTINVIEGPFMKTFGETYVYKEIHDDLGYILVAIAIMTGGPAQGNGTLAMITFNSTYYGPASCALDLYRTELDDPGGAPISHDVADGYYEFVILGLTVATSKQVYRPEENITIYGNLTRNGAPMEGLVALEVTDPNDQTIMLRTLQSGTNPISGDFEIVSIGTYKKVALYEWVPTDTFEVGSEAWFNVTVKNVGTVTKNVTVAINIYDGSNIPIGVAAESYSLLPNSPSWSMRSIVIPYWASIGTGKVYASVFTALPILGGIAYCTEKSTSFNIVTSGGGGAATLEMQESNINFYAPNLADPSGNYNLTFKIFSGKESTADNRRKIGTYNVHVSSSYGKQHKVEITTFKFRVPGDVDGDDDVDITDLILFTDSWYKSPPDPLYNPNADFNNDGMVDILDLIILTDNWYRW